MGRDVPDLEKLYAIKLWADFSYPIETVTCEFTLLSSSPHTLKTLTSLNKEVRAFKERRIRENRGSSRIWKFACRPF